MFSTKGDKETMTDKPKVLFVRVPESVHRAIKIKACKLGISVTAAVENLLVSRCRKELRESQSREEMHI